MSRNVWHKRFHADALQGYMGLTLEERGAYTTVLDLLYSSDWSDGIPDRPRWIAGHLNCSVRKWESLRSSLLEQGKIFLTEDGLISNSRYRLERKNALETSRANAKNGSAGGRKSGEKRAKSLETLEPDEANASKNRSHTRALEAEEIREEKKEERETPALLPTVDAGAKTLFDDAQPEPDQDQGKYEFCGRTVRLTKKDFDQWRARYHGLSDIRAELGSLDDWLQGRDEEARKRWFHTVSGALNRKHQEIIDAGKKAKTASTSFNRPC